MVNSTLNVTLEHLTTNAPAHGTELNATTDDVCAPKYFIINSQVKKSFDGKKRKGFEHANWK